MSLFLLEHEKIDNLDFLSENEKFFLKNPMKEIHFTISVRKDNGEKKFFNAYRIQHNSSLGPYKGGIRFQKDLDVDTLRALSFWMTWKCAIAKLPLGGGKGGVDCDITSLSIYEQEQICRGYIDGIFKDIGPNLDIPAPDINTNNQHMLWMMDEYEKLIGEKAPGVITGKPVGVGGSLGRGEATGYGIVYVLNEYLKNINIDINKMSASIQGFGEVGKHAADLFCQRGGIVTAISFFDTKEKKTCTISKNGECNIPELLNQSELSGELYIEDVRKLGYTISEGDDWYKQDVDILIPAALENQLDENAINSVSDKVKIICEGANGPTTKEGNILAEKKDITILPDVLCNSGGVTCSYFEQVQNNTNYYWEKEEVFEKLEKSMISAFYNIYEYSKENGTTMKDACFSYATDSVIKSSRLRGWI